MSILAVSVRTVFFDEPLPRVPGPLRGFIVEMIVELGAEHPLWTVLRFIVTRASGSRGLTPPLP